jgi:hypothetical protein
MGITVAPGILEEQLDAPNAELEEFVEDLMERGFSREKAIEELRWIRMR